MKPGQCVRFFQSKDGIGSIKELKDSVFLMMIVQLFSSLELKTSLQYAICIVSLG